MWTAILDTVCLKYFLPLVMFFFLVFGFDKLQLWWLPLGFSFSFWFLFWQISTLLTATSNLFTTLADSFPPQTSGNHLHQNHTKVSKSHWNHTEITPNSSNHTEITLESHQSFLSHHLHLPPHPFQGRLSNCLANRLLNERKTIFVFIAVLLFCLWNPALKLWIEYWKEGQMWILEIWKS